MSKSKKKVIIVGGGISGLSTAFWLMEKGIEVLLLEKDKRAGGLIQSKSVDGFLLDYAANCVFNYLPEINYLINSVGLGQKQILRQEEAKKRYLVKNGLPTQVPMKFKDFIFTDLWSVKAKLRLLLEPFIPRGEQGVEETVAQFISRRFGREIFEQSIEPYIAGTLAGDAEKSCLTSTFQQFSSIEKEHGSIVKGVIARKLKGVRTACAAQVFSFDDGMGTLTESLQNYLADSIVLDTSVTAIERTGKKWSVTADVSGNNEIFTADAVVLSTPADAASKLTKPISKQLGTLLNSVTYSPMAVTFLGYSKKDIKQKLDGIGCLIPKKEKDFNTLGSLWSSTLFEGRSSKDEALFTTYAGGARNPQMFGKSDEELLSISTKDLDNIVGLKGDPTLAKVVRHQKALPQYNLGHQMFLSRLEENLRLTPGLHITGNYLKGASVRVCISQGKETADKLETQLGQSNGRFSSGINKLKVAEKVTS